MTEDMTSEMIDRMCEAHTQALVKQAVKWTDQSVWSLMPEPLKEERRAAMRAAVACLDD